MPVLARCKSLKPHGFDFKGAIAHGVCDNLSPTARKLLILNGEMSEWLKEHAWKTNPATLTEYY